MHIIYIQELYTVGSTQIGGFLTRSIDLVKSPKKFIKCGQVNYMNFRLYYLKLLDISLLDNI